MKSKLIVAVFMVAMSPFIIVGILARVCVNSVIVGWQSTDEFLMASYRQALKKEGPR